MKNPPKILYIEAKSNLNYKLPKKEIKRLPKKLLLLYSIQYKKLAETIKKQLQASGISISQTQQVLGCSKISNPQNLPFLLVSTGKFHAQNLSSQTPALYIIDNKKITQIPKQEINKLKTQRKTALMKFLKADNIGILVSTKPGQNNLDQAIKLKQELNKKGKQPYIFLANNIDTAQFENFNIDAWVNTACSGLAYNNSDIINMDELPKL